MNITIEVNNTRLQAQEGETLLTALRQNGIRIPTLCHLAGFYPSGACRLCVVEVEGKRDLITSCTYPVEQGLVVKTNSARVINARKAIVEMLLANHPDDCLYCERNGNCELQWLAHELHVKERKFFSKKILIKGIIPVPAYTAIRPNVSCAIVVLEFARMFSSSQPLNSSREATKQR
jgi:NADH dehydrogenase/NADH:ubiquinone oxidoreductase subunit G